MSSKWPLPPSKKFTDKLAWRVIAVLHNGRSIGNCGHNHRTDMAAVRCPWTPEVWPDRCDLLVRQMRRDVGP